LLKDIAFDLSAKNRIVKPVPVEKRGIEPQENLPRVFLPRPPASGLMRVALTDVSQT
jgi:hypothetical protein